MLSLAFDVTVPQFGHRARLSGISSPHRTQVAIGGLSFVSDALLSSLRIIAYRVNSSKCEVHRRVYHVSLSMHC